MNLDEAEENIKGLGALLALELKELKKRAEAETLSPCMQKRIDYPAKRVPKVSLGAGFGDCNLSNNQRLMDVLSPMTSPLNRATTMSPKTVSRTKTTTALRPSNASPIPRRSRRMTTRTGTTDNR